MVVICKMYAARIATVEATGLQDSTYYEAVLRPVISGSEENKMFFKWTPGGEATIRSPHIGVVAALKGPGEFYVRFAREFRTSADLEAAKAGHGVPPPDAMRFRVASIGNRSNDAEKLYDLTLQGVNDAGGSSIQINTINEAAAREFLGFDSMLVWFERAEKALDSPTLGG